MAAAPRRVVVCGASGACGRAALHALEALEPPADVVALVRRERPLATTPDGAPIDASRIRAVTLVDYERLVVEGPTGAHATQLFGGATHVVQCLGTTRKDAGSRAAFQRVDYDYVEAVIRAARKHGVENYAQVSSQGADAKSCFLYMRTKGQADALATAAGFRTVCILRPGLLGRGDVARPVERALGVAMRATPVAAVGRALLQCVETAPAGTHILSDQVIRSLAVGKSSWMTMR